MSGPIICGVASTPETRDAVALASTLSERLGLPLLLAHVVDTPVIAADSVTAAGDRGGAQRLLASLRRDLTVEAETRLEVGDRARVLAAIAEDVDASLIVVGARKSGLRGTK